MSAWDRIAERSGDQRHKRVVMERIPCRYPQNCGREWCDCPAQQEPAKNCHYCETTGWELNVDAIGLGSPVTWRKCSACGNPERMPQP
jgi:hypothetical protein